jgi:predicted ABC-type ATPase
LKNIGKTIGMSKKILMIAGPNGAGKTTMTLELIRSCAMLYEFINADEIARGLAPKHPESMALTASKLMIKRLKELLDAEKSFAFETTASGTNYVKHLKTAKAKGYEISLTFLWLSKPEEAVRRVAQRVKQGGHHVPEDSITRRYYAGIKNLMFHYLPLADEALVMDNSLEEEASKRVIARKNRNNPIDILDRIVWGKIEEIANER